MSKIDQILLEKIDEICESFDVPELQAPLRKLISKKINNEISEEHQHESIELILNSLMENSNAD